MSARAGRWRGTRPQAAALPAQLADLGRDWEAVVIGEYERAFYGSQYALLAPLYSAVRRPAFSPGERRWISATPRTGPGRRAA